jgi:hypothetical protein
LVEARGHVNAILGRGEAVFCGAEHEGFVKDTNTPELDLEFLDPGGERAGLLVKVRDADGSALEDGCLG